VSLDHQAVPVAQSAAGARTCAPGCTGACCRPPAERAAAWHAAAGKAKLLSWLSLAYMAAEGAIALAAAALAASVALLGFSLDSVIEGLASVIIVWRFSGPGRCHRAKAPRTCCAPTWLPQF